MDGIRHIDLNDRDQGQVKLALIVPKNGDPWGIMAPLKGTAWGDLIKVVPGDVVSHALHGWATPLMRVIGTPPHGLMRRISPDMGRCALHDNCLGYKAKHCLPCPTVPDCYEPPKVDSISSALITNLVWAWKDNRYVLVVGDGEFSIT